MEPWNPPLTDEELVETFELLGSWEERYRFLIDLGRKLPELPPELMTDEYRVFGCQSQVWIVPRRVEGPPDRLVFLATSDAHIVRGLIAVLLIAYQGKTPQEILDYDIEGLFERLELQAHLSSTRNNGLREMVKRIRAIAESVLREGEESP